MDWETLNKLVGIVQEIAAKTSNGGGPAGVWLHNLWLIGKEGCLDSDAERAAAVGVLNEQLGDSLFAAVEVLFLGGAMVGVDVEGFIDTLTIAAFTKMTLRIVGVDVPDSEPGVPMSDIFSGEYAA